MVEYKLFEEFELFGGGHVEEGVEISLHDVATLVEEFSKHSIDSSLRLIVLQESSVWILKSKPVWALCPGYLDTVNINRYRCFRGSKSAYILSVSCDGVGYGIEKGALSFAGGTGEENDTGGGGMNIL